MGIFASMKSTIDVPDEVLRDAMRLSRASTKREAVVTAMADHVQRRKMAALAVHLGSCAQQMTPAELE